MDINLLAEMVHKLAWEKGWHDQKEDENFFIERTCNNLHDEISELHEAWRNNSLHSFCDKAELMRSCGIKPLTYLEEELADIIIRTLDSCIKLGVDISSAIERKHKFNTFRPIRHGGKKS
jgi:NTP pyrophosphatase (non-canonical NTP hydrolase)